MLFINQDRSVTDAIIAAARQRLADDSAAIAALDTGVQECRSQYDGMDYPLHRLVIDWPVVIEGNRRRPYDGPGIILAVLADERPDEETRFHLYGALASVNLRGHHSLQALRLAQVGSPAAAALRPPTFRRLQLRIAVLMFTGGRLLAARALVAKWPPNQADQARSLAFMAHDEPTGVNASAILRDITNPTLRTATLTARIDRETTEGRGRVAAQLRRLRGQTANLPAYLRVVK
jgi:hypothetical protein